ncbi:MAG: glycosyltransferase [Synergistaceae bacterium]|nr:glycosyltransferase [Synergistaceae bacterium]
MNTIPSTEKATEISKVSVIIPVYNEEESLPHLFEAITPVMEGLGRDWEILFINDGSKDRSFALLRAFCNQHPGHARMIDFNGNFGQHMAIMAGFEHALGEIIITIDADLQTPATEIPRLVAEIDSGHDVVGTYRQGRQDPFFRKFASRIVNRVTNKISGLKLRDYGCMLRAYRRDIIEIINESQESTTFIPALASRFASNPVEIPISHCEREHGQSKYGLFQLIRLNFDLMTGFSVVPLQVVTFIGMCLSAGSVFFFLFLLGRRLFIGPEAEGLFTLMAIQFLLTGITLLSVGISGEYIGRIYGEVRKRPRYVVRKIYDGQQEAPPNER